MTHQVNNEDNFDTFSTVLNEIALKRFNEFASSGEQILLVRFRGSVMDEFLGAFPEDQRQQYNCRTCKRFFDGVGSFAHIGEDLTLQPLVFDPNFDLGVAYPQFQAAYAAVMEIFKDASRFDIVTASSLENAGDLVGNEHCGGFSHIALPLDAFDVRVFLTNCATTSTQHTAGVGDVIIADHHTLFRMLGEKFESTDGLPLERLRESDRATILDLITVAQTYMECDRHAFVRRFVIMNPFNAVQRMNTAAGGFLKDILKGRSYQEALDRYMTYVDPRYYKRPIRLPTEAEFDTSVKFLEESGYAEKLPQRLATMEEALALAAWRAPVTETAASGSMFDKLRQKIEKKNGEPKKELEAMEEEMISLYGLNEVLKEMIEKDELRGIEFRVNGHYPGSFTSCQNPMGATLFKDQRSTHWFFLGQPIGHDSADRHYKVTSHKAKGLIMDKDDLGNPMLISVLDGTWKSTLPTPVFTDDLIGELQPHSRVLEHWASSTSINSDENDKAIEYPNTPIAILLSFGNVVIAETDHCRFTFRVSSRR